MGLGDGRPLRRSEARGDSNGQLYAPLIRQVVADGSYHFYPNARGPNSQALLDALHPTLHDEGSSKIYSWDLKGSRELMQLRGGMAAIAAGLEARKEEMDIESDPRTGRGRHRGPCLVHGPRRSQRSLGVRGAFAAGDQEPRDLPRGTL
jgi:iron complex outermembrane receptor protein